MEVFLVIKGVVEGDGTQILGAFFQKDEAEAKAKEFARKYAEFYGFPLTEGECEYEVGHYLWYVWGVEVL